jgi:hypothetical protein
MAGTRTGDDRNPVPDMFKIAIGYFRWAFGFTVLGLALSFWIGLRSTGEIEDGISFLLIATVLAVLEISLSFDNAIINANRLGRMTPAWQRRFLTWGILIAVFGMRILFPLIVVSLAVWIPPHAALEIAVHDPRLYAEIMEHAHLPISAFGGSFLMMVAMNYFIDDAKEVDWIRVLECQLRRCASIRGLEISLVSLIILALALAQPPELRASFLIAALLGLVIFQAIEILSRVLDLAEAARGAARMGGFGAFLYLEVLDASFSFDGVIGAFALTQNLFLIAIGLGIGAFYVRSMTIMLVERRTLAQFRYLEHGAFYSIFLLAMIMFAQSLVDIPEMATGLMGAVLIGLSLWSSVVHNRRKALSDKA